jgi:two-component system OmpR family response regulator
MPNWSYAVSGGPVAVRVLLVEDDPKISRFLVKGLREERHVVVHLTEGAAAEERAELEAFDVIVLDLLLPDRGGVEVCRNLRAAGIETPILMLTAMGAVSDRVLGLDAGADDYLVKPFAFEELEARLRALARRGRAGLRPGLLCEGPLEIDTEAHRVRLEGRELELSATEYRLLEYLTRRAGTIVSREQLADQVWGDEYDPFSNLADVYVSYLRKKLARPLIHTVRGLGYMLKDRSLRP